MNLMHIERRVADPLVRCLIATALALSLVALALGPAAGAASADVDGPNHGCVEHPAGSSEYNEECNAGPAPATSQAPAAPQAPAATLPDTGGMAPLIPLAGAVLFGTGALVAVGVTRLQHRRSGKNRQT